MEGDWKRGGLEKKEITRQRIAKRKGQKMMRSGGGELKMASRKGVKTNLEEGNHRLNLKRISLGTRAN